jgi:hypothetical protein
MRLDDCWVRYVRLLQETQLCRGAGALPSAVQLSVLRRNAANRCGSFGRSLEHRRLGVAGANSRLALLL